MTIEKAKAAALEVLLAGPFVPEPGDTRAPAIHLLKSEGVPIVSSSILRRGVVRVRHELRDTQLDAEAIKAARREGLRLALQWHRHEPAANWSDLVAAIECEFVRDEAKQYLQTIRARATRIGH